MKIVEISASLGNGLKGYNTLTKVSISEQPFEQRTTVLYGVTKPTDIVQTNAPTNILIDINGNPIGNSQPFYFGIRVYPFISELQNFSCNNNTISYGELLDLSAVNYFPEKADYRNRTLLPPPYTGKLYPQPEFVQSLPDSQLFRRNYAQAMQQFVNDCTFPTKPNFDLPGQSQSSGSSDKGIGYFSPNVYMTPKNEEPKGVLCLIQDKIQDEGYNVEPWAYEDYMVQFDGKKLNFKFGMAVNSDFAETPDIVLPYLYRTYVALIPKYHRDICLGVIMQCLLYDSNGNVISA